MPARCSLPTDCKQSVKNLFKRQFHTESRSAKGAQKVFLGLEKLKSLPLFTGEHPRWVYCRIVMCTPWYDMTYRSITLVYGNTYKATRSRRSNSTYILLAGGRRSVHEQNVEGRPQELFLYLVEKLVFLSCKVAMDDRK